MVFFDTVKQVGFYGAYHNNKTNQIIHFFFIPMILWTFFSMLAHVEVDVPVVGEMLGMGPMPLSYPMAAFYAGFYLMLDLPVGLVCAAILGVFGITSTDFARDYENSLEKAFALHCVAWTIQFLGHAVFEKRAPALKESILQAFLLAPFFVAMETTFALGFKEELHEEVKKLVHADIMKFKAEKKAAKVE